MDKSVWKDKIRLALPAHKIENGAWKQIENFASIPECVTLAVMPDVHQGYDLCIGGVALMDGLISPAAVGYDIGCGMGHINTGVLWENWVRRNTLFDEEETAQRYILDGLERNIPTGFSELSDTQMRKNKAGRKNTFRHTDRSLEEKVSAKLHKQLGTLGGGNHFLEIGKNSKGFIGITVHSGSRKTGWLIAEYWMKYAKEHGIRRKGAHSELFFLDMQSEAGRKYLEDVNFALDYAYVNRRIMLEHAMDMLGLNINEYDVVNEAHNTAEKYENTLVLHRKGATPAGLDELGIIPANMRDGVWIVRGMGNTHYLESASHGAGRTMGRNKAKKAFKDETHLTNALIPNGDFADEHGDAYKPIDEVLARQTSRSMIEVVDHFEPLVCLKG